jgi:cobalt-zinc-cadmium resistance protein CzcA
MEKNNCKNNSVSPIFNTTEKLSTDIHNAYLERVTDNYKSQIILEKQHWLPDLHLEYLEARIKDYHNH